MFFFFGIVLQHIATIHQSAALWFELICPEGSFTLFASSPEEKNAWIRDIRNALAASVEVRPPRSLGEVLCEHATGTDRRGGGAAGR
jgi:hypothetical protein